MTRIEEIKVELFDIFVEQSKLKHEYNVLEKIKNKLAEEIDKLIHVKPEEGPAPEPSNK